jgi:hypothetical protein
MDQEEIDELEPELAQRLVEGPTGVIGPVEPVVELAGDEHLGPVEIRSGDGQSDPFLVLVHLGGVDVPVADAEGRGGGGLGIGRRDLEHPEPELWDGVAVVQDEGGNGVRRGLVGAHRTGQL